MKVKVKDRMLLAVYAILGVILALGIGAIAVVEIIFPNQFSFQIAGLRMTLVDSPWVLIVIGLIALMLLAWSIWILTLAFRRETTKDKASVSVQNTENGDVRVSVQAIDMLVKRAISGTEGIVDVKTRVINHDDSITVKADMTLDSDVHIPNTTMLMQRSIKSFIEEFSGIAVRDVQILVSKIIEVTPHPPLALESKSNIVSEIIEAPDAIEPEADELQESESPQPSEIEDGMPVEEHEADHGESLEGDALESDAPDEASTRISEKDIW